MRYKQLGNGGAFNYQMPNSSFLIENNNKYLLFDCGYSVYDKLRRQDANKEIDLKKLNSIYISHMDDDHMGSLKTLLYYQYFVNGITTTVYAHKEVHVMLRNMFSGFNTKKENGEYVFANIMILTEVPHNNKNFQINGMWVNPTYTDHHTECYGLYAEVEHESCIYITGDTKALPSIAHDMDLLAQVYGDRFVMFHDFSNWDNEGSQVHACKTDIERIYGKITDPRVKWYHNDEYFDGNWVEL